MIQRAVGLTLALACAACPSTPATVDAGVPSLPDAGTQVRAVEAVVDAGSVVVSAPDAVPLAPDALAFRFVRLRAPTPGGEEIVRIGLHERARTVDGALELRSAPSPDTLAPLVAACANANVRAALRRPGDTAPTMTIIELDCAPVRGVVACDPSAPCGAAFDDVRAAVVAAWREEQVVPDDGIGLRITRWIGTAVAPYKSDIVMSLHGKPLPYAKGDPVARAPSGARVTVCSEAFNGRRTCTTVVAPSLVHLDIVDDAERFRCATCMDLPTTGPSVSQRDIDPVLGY